MKAPSSRLGQFALLFIAEFVAFFIIVANTRAFTHDSYLWTAITDALFTLQSFAMAKLMMDDAKARSWAAVAGATIGGTCGSLLSIYVTKQLHF